MIGKVVNTMLTRYNKQTKIIWYGIDWGKNVNGHDIGGLTKIRSWILCTLKQI